MIIDIEQYEICQRRGHKPSNSSLHQGDRLIEVCKYCHVSYYIEIVRTVHDLNPPEPRDEVLDD